MIKIIVAMDRNQLIGKKDSSNGMPWHNKEELKHFRTTTLHHTILMGYTTYQAIGKPLPDRHTIVLNYEVFDDDRIEVRTNLEEVLNEYKHKDEILYICGGASIYKQCLPYADELLISRMPGVYTGETYFPDFLSLGFKLKETESFESFDLQIYRRD